MDDIFAQLKSALLFSVAGFIVYKIVLAIHNFKSYVKIFDACPGETDFHWLYGNIHKTPGSNEAGIQYDIDAMEKRPRFSRFWVGPFRAILILVHPDLVRKVLKSSAPKPRGRIMKSVYDMVMGWLGKGLLLANGPQWAQSRRLLTPAFHFDILRRYVRVKNQAADVLLSKMKAHSEEKKPFKTFYNVSLCLFDVLLQCAFAHESNCQTTGQKDPYLQNVNELVELWSERSLKPWLHLEWVFRLSPQGRRWYKLCDEVHAVSEDLIERRRKALEAKEAAGDKGSSDEESTGRKHLMCFVDVLLSARDENGVGMTPLEIRNEADTFLFAGYDTTSSALSWTLYSLARWTEHQTLVQEEVDALLQDRSSDYIMWDDLSCLPYTTACIKEAIRNYSTVPFIQREITEPLNLDGHIIPAGTFIAIQIWCVHHNPTVWDRPHEYLPERFLGNNPVDMDPFQYVPFSAGPRNCIGQNFAMHELKVMVARILHRFTLALDPTHEVLRAPMVTFKAEKDIKLLITPREH